MPYIASKSTPAAHDTPSSRVSALLAARNIERFQLAESAPDIRGWHVISSDHRLIGTVARLIVEIRTRRVRYVVVALDPDLERRTRRVPSTSVLLPVGLGRPVDESCAIMLDSVHSEQIQVAPRIPERPINRDDEERTLTALGLPGLAAGDDPYAGRHFDERSVLAPRH